MLVFVEFLFEVSCDWAVTCSTSLFLGSGSASLVLRFVAVGDEDGGIEDELISDDQRRVPSPIQTSLIASSG